MIHGCIYEFWMLLCPFIKDSPVYPLLKEVIKEPLDLHWVSSSASVSQVRFCEACLLPAVFEDRHMCSLNTGNTFLSSWLYSFSSFVCLQVSTQPLLCLLALHSSCQHFEWDCSGNKKKTTALEIYLKLGYRISVWVETHAETCNYWSTFIGQTQTLNDP